MEKGRPRLRWVVILCVSMAVAGFGLNALGGKQDSVAAKKLGADLITIETLQQFGELEYPVVRFEHDKHSKAVEGKCESCHTVKGNTVTAKFKRDDDAAGKDIKAVYHDNCISCHESMAKAGKKSGPDSGQCRTCHAGPAESSRTPISFDKSLHSRHQMSKMVPPAAGQKDNCSKCHTNDKPEKRDLSFAQNREEAHAKCMSCHMEITKAKQDSGPVECAGCHDAAVRASFKVVKDAPRLEAGQADVALIMAPAAKDAKQVKVVAFNHKAHEAQAENCSTCHHTAMTKGVVKCTECHTTLGKEEGGFITTEQAMHDVTSSASCVGCHAKAQKKAQCAGCHTFMGRKGSMTDTSCIKCHKSVPADSGVQADATLAGNMAASLVAARPQADTAVKVDEIPETIEIGSLADEFQASKFPHRKIVQKILEGMKDDRMAAYFHSSPNAVCSGCHHNSPASATPPACGSCHGKVATEKDGAKPALKAAYHQQCMGCHQAMGIQKPADTACVECHAKKQ